MLSQFMSLIVHVFMQVTTQFLKMESLLDDSVGQNVELELERGGISLTVQLTVSFLNL